MNQKKYSDEEIQEVLSTIKKIKSNLVENDFSETERKVLFELFAKDIIDGGKQIINNPNSGQIKIEEFSPGPIVGANTSFIALLKKTKFESHPDRVLLATYFVTQVSKEKESVNADDINAMYTKALLKKSSNTSQMINENRKKDYMMEFEKQGGKQTYKITMSGIEYINQKLQNGN